MVDGVKDNEETAVWAHVTIAERKANLFRNCPLWASIAGRREPAPQIITHQPQHKDNSESPQISTILCINGLIGCSPVTFLLDSGATISVVRLDTTASEFRDRITKHTSGAP